MTQPSDLDNIMVIYGKVMKSDIKNINSIE